MERQLITSLVSSAFFLFSFCDVGRGQVEGGTVEVLGGIIGHHWYWFSIVYPLQAALGTSDHRTCPLCGTIDIAITGKTECLVLWHNRYKW